MAKLHFRHLVEQQDVDQALKLMDYSIRSLRNIKDDQNQKRKQRKYLSISYREFRQKRRAQGQDDFNHQRHQKSDDSKQPAANEYQRDHEQAAEDEPRSV
jgi:DNA replicative helicase MCM subunit Mcm2 (Cdc46/Mcm family)